jgi:transcriptional regulator with XRE-family HTH domain
MDSKNVGATIARLRRQKKMTQGDLAKLLNVSSKAISKWETGKGYPDVELFPELAKILCVTIDYIMLGEDNE